MPSLVSPTVAALINAGEGQTVEFKDERIKPSDLAETLVAFANTDGGTVVIGVSDDRSTKGVTDAKIAIDNALIAASRECSDPAVVLGSVRQVSLSPGKTAIVVRVPKATSSVHSAQGRFFKREGSRNVSLGAEELRRLISSRSGDDALSKTARGRRLGSGSSPAYELLRHQVTLTLLDVKGQEAIVERRQHLRFLQDNVIALYDRTWGDGQIFSSYRVTQGRVADRFRAGSRYHTLISLRDTKRRGDTLNYRIRRRISGGFTHREEWYEVDVDHPTHFLQINIIFPQGRSCLDAQLIEASSNRHFPLDSHNFHRKRDGRQLLTWSTNKPVLGERYAIHWRW